MLYLLCNVDLVFCYYQAYSGILSKIKAAEAAGEREKKIRSLPESDLNMKTKTLIDL